MASSMTKSQKTENKREGGRRKEDIQGGSKVKEVIVKRIKAKRHPREIWQAGY